MTPEPLTELIDNLEAAAARLRAGDLEPEAAAALVDDCARSAARAAGELDRQARAAEPGPDQDSLL